MMLFGWNIRFINYLILFKNVNGTKFDKMVFVIVRAAFDFVYFAQWFGTLFFFQIFFCLPFEIDKLQQSMKET